MRHVRITADVDAERAPAFFNLLANSTRIEEARVLDVNTTLDGVDNYLLAIDGDATAFGERATETPGVESVELSEPERGRTYALVVMRSLETPLYEEFLRMSSVPGLIIRTPFVYRDGTLAGRAVGDAETLQAAMAAMPEALDLRIEEIGRFRGRFDDPLATLSERQREALAVAVGLGYYEQPREATHADVAAELGCAPPTASEHLQKAEAKLVRTVLEAFGPTV